MKNSIWFVEIHRHDNGARTWSDYFLVPAETEEDARTQVEVVRFEDEIRECYLIDLSYSQYIGASDDGVYFPKKVEGIESKVRRAITYMYGFEFTVDQIADTTDIEYQVAETIIQGLLKEDYIVRTESQRSGARKYGAQPRKTYVLTEDSETLKKFRAGIEGEV